MKLCKRLSGLIGFFGHGFLLLLIINNAYSLTLRTNFAKPDSISPNKAIIRFTGFLRHEMFFDFRQTVNAREALVTLYPENVLPDENGKDINARSHFNMLNINSRLRAELIGPTYFGAKTDALLEIDFYGNENRYFSDLNGLRLFNGYFRIVWPKTTLLLGQEWHPMSVKEVFPVTVAFSAGAPFHPMSRNPQARVTQSIGNFKLLVAILSQRDFTGTGPEEPGSQYLRNSGVPNIHFQTYLGCDSSRIFGGAGVDYKMIVPELFTFGESGQLYKAKSHLNSLAATGFFRFRTKSLNFKGQAVWSQNSFDLLMIGGYARSSISNMRTGQSEFANLGTLSFWVDMETQRTGRFTLGLFSGFSENIGANKSIMGEIYARAPNLKMLYRIAPRIIFTHNSLSLAFEPELTSAYYGLINGDGRGGVTGATEVSNLRFLISTRFNF